MFLVTAVHQTIAKHFNFPGQGTPSPVCPWPTAFEVCEPTAKVF
jgi:hypothetical protein